MYITDTSKISADEKLTLGINLGVSKFQHAIVIVEDLRYSASTYSNYFLQNYNIYVGENSDYSLNTPCEGGPFMQIDDPTSKSEGKWKFFKEVWCNLQGQYMHIVVERGGTDLMAIGSIAIIGSDYQRPIAIPTSV